MKTWGGSLRRWSGPATAGLWLLAVIGQSGCVSADVRARRDAARERAAEIAQADAARAADEGQPARPPYRFQPGDTLALRFFYNPELDEEVAIRPDGRFSLQLVGEIQAAGLTSAELSDELIDRYQPFLRNIDVSVNVETFGAQVAYVGGEVRDPGVIPLTPGMTALQAIFAAGGALDTAEMRNVIVVRDTGAGQAEFLMLDLKSGLRNMTAYTDIALQPKDIVFAPMSSVAEAGLWVRQHINELLPLTKTFNVTYQFGSLGVQ